MDFDLQMLKNQQTLYSLMKKMDKKIDRIIHQVESINEYIGPIEDGCAGREGYEQDT